MSVFAESAFHLELTPRIKKSGEDGILARIFNALVKVNSRTFMQICSTRMLEFVKRLLKGIQTQSRRKLGFSVWVTYLAFRDRLL